MKSKIGNVKIPNKFFETNIVKAKIENKFKLNEAFNAVIRILNNKDEIKASNSIEFDNLDTLNNYQNDKISFNLIGNDVPLNDKFNKIHFVSKNRLET